jgi:hypothetical protein
MRYQAGYSGHGLRRGEVEDVLPAPGTYRLRVLQPLSRCRTIISCWVARTEMTEDFVLLNGI